MCEIKCKFALSVISYERLQVEKYVHISYYVDTYVKAYGLPIYPINGEEERKEHKAAIF